ncbi:hypothetical protein pipiens_020305, partial [Culex pipiens pipiens]
MQVHVVASRLDGDTHKAFESHVVGQSSVEWSEMVDFLLNRCRILENLEQERKQTRVHPKPVGARLQPKVLVSATRDEEKRNFGYFNCTDAEFQRFLENFNQNSLPVDECLQSITGTYSQLIQANSRTRTVEVKVKNDCCPWYNFDIWKLGNIRDSILKRWKRNRQDQHLSELLARANYNLSEAKKRAKKQYHTKLFNNGNAKLLWGRINELMGGKSRTNSAPSLEVNQNIEHDPVTVANLFNDHFVSVGDNLASQLTSDGNINRFNTMKRSNISIFLRPASILEISNLIHELDPKKASGYDGFPVSALKKHRNLLSAIICNCFNQCTLLVNNPRPDLVDPALDSKKTFGPVASEDRSVEPKSSPKKVQLISTSGQALLHTAIVYVQGSNGKCKSVVRSWTRVQ